MRQPLASRCNTKIGCQNQPMTPESQPEDPNVIVVGPDGDPIEQPQDDAAAAEAGVTDLVEQPAKVMRIGSMIKQLLEAVRD